MAGGRGRAALVLGPVLAGLLLVASSAGTARVARTVPVAAAGVTDQAAGDLAFAGRVAVGSCPLPASRAGICGTVAGFTGWYGSWTTAADSGAYCLQHARNEPRPGLAYTRLGTAVGVTHMPPEDRARLGYLLGRYGATRDPATAAALAILVHATQGDSLTTSDLRGYGTTLPPSVRARVLALWAEAAELHGPYDVTMSVHPAGAGAVGTLTVRSAAGRGVPGARVSWAGSSHGDETTETDPDGTARLRIGTVLPGGSVTAVATVTGLTRPDFSVWVPHDPSVQEVAVPLAGVSAQVRRSWTAPAPVAPPAATPPAATPPAATAPQPASLAVVKITTDPAYVGPGGAVFDVTDGTGSPVGTLSTAADGRTPVLTGLDPDATPYTVTERIPCPGCELAPPVTVDASAGQLATAAVTDRVTPRELLLRKVTPDGAPLAGAVLHLRAASIAGGAYDLDLGTCVSAADGSCAPPGGPALPPGDYQVAEETPAPGTVAASPSVQTVSLRGTDVTVTFADPRLTSVAFRKTDDAPGSVVDRQHGSLAGAVFAVSTAPESTGLSPGSGPEVGRCTTTADGTCSLPAQALVEGRPYSWSEVGAPPGFALDPSAHAFTGQCCAPVVLQAADVGRYADVSLVKHAAGDPSVRVAGATVDLCATALPAALAGTWADPPKPLCRDGATWVGTAITGPDGRADFGLQLPGSHYCAIERTAPPGWLAAPDPVCGDLARAGSAGDPAPAALTLDLAETHLPPVVAAAAPSPSVAPSAGKPGPLPVTPVRPTGPAPTPHAKPIRPLPAPTSGPVTTAAVGPRGARAAGPRGPTLAFTGVAQAAPAATAGVVLLVLGIGCLALASAPRRPGHPTWGGWTPGDP